MRKRRFLLSLLTVMLAVIMAVMLFTVIAFAADEPDVWDGTVASSFDSGTGTEADPYIIKIPEQLAYLASSVNSGTNYSGKYIKLANNIYLNDTTNWENWDKTVPKNAWTPIGIYVYGDEKPFSGTFDGDGHVIYGIFTDSTKDCKGLFGYNSYGTIKNLGIVSSYIFANKCVGGVCGSNNRGTISNCYNSGTVSGSSYYVGGVCGSNNGTISNCYNIGAVSGNSYHVGGVCGSNSYSSTISNCYYLTGCAKDGNNTTQYGIGNSTKGSTTADIIDCTTGLTSIQMKSQSSFVGFDFVNTWAIEVSTGYEYPQFIKNLDPSLYSGAAIWTGTVANGFARGIGTESDPYIIETAEQLAYLAQTVNNGKNYYCRFIKLANDIVLSNTDIKYWKYSATVWTPIGIGSNEFYGTFDGDGYKIYGIYTDSTQDEQGLFGYSRGTIKNLGIEKSYICGIKAIGGVCGRNIGTIANCYNSSPVIGSGNYVGGVCGTTGSNGGGKVINCYNIGTVSGNDHVGGVCGSNSDAGTVMICYNSGTVSGNNYVGGVCGGNSDGTTSNCYNVGAVSGSGYVGGVCGLGKNSIYPKSDGTLTNCYNIGEVSGSSSVGGIVGDSGTVSNCYYLSDCINNRTNAYGDDLTDTEMKLKTSFLGFDFCGIWAIEPATGYYYPQFIGNLDSSLYSGAEIWKGIVTDGFASGSGTESDPYIIETAEQLAYLAKTVNNGNGYLNKFIKLANDIVISNTDIKYWGYSAIAWTPIGTSFKYFQGTFDGDGHAIYGIYTDSTNDYQGLFGYSSGTIKNLGIEKSYICGNEYVGSICGKIQGGTISNCYNTGEVVGESKCVGGVCGYNYNGAIANCYNSGDIGAAYKIGGVCGYNDNGIITYCYNIGAINDAYYAGGVCGYNDNGTIANCYNRGIISMGGGVCGENYGTISNCYNTGTVSGDGSAGGVCGSNNGTISNCYNSGTVSGDSYVGGVCGTNGNGNNGTIRSCYNTGLVSGSGNYVGGVCGYNGYNNKVIIANCHYLSGCAKDGNNTVQYGIGNETKENTTADVSSCTAGLTDLQMNEKVSFVGFDFENIWTIEPSTGYNYPQLILLLDKSLGETQTVWDGEAANCYNSGSGTENDPYIIKTAAQLAYLAQMVNNGTGYSGEYFKLSNDIILNDSSKKYWMLNANLWIPIGAHSNKPFKGTFDGNGHVIYGIYTDITKNCQGLFGNVFYGTITNIGIEDSYIYGKNNVGGICGLGDEYGTISNCYNNGTIAGIRYVGGVCGRTEITITNCYNRGSVNGTDWVGGICGYFEKECNGTTINNCYNCGTVTGSYYVGSICGEHYYSSEIMNCYYLFGCAKDGNNVEQYGLGDKTPGCTEEDWSGITTGLSDTEMKLQEWFAEFDFDTVWTMGGDEDYLYPELQCMTILRGDVNGDDEINSDDAIYLLRYTLMPTRYPINQIGDMNGDGEVNSDDAIYLLRHTLMPSRYPLK